MPPPIPMQLMPGETEKLLARRLKALRLQAGYKRTTLALRSGVSAASLKRFEESGQISLQSLLCLAYALNRLDEFNTLLMPPAATSLAELKRRSSETTPKRGKI